MMSALPQPVADTREDYGSGAAQAEALLEEFGWEIDHSRHVRHLAIALFDQLQPLHRLGPDERSILNAAALLHDLGWTINGAKHHKLSYQLIRDRESSLSAFTPGQVELIAIVARYHRKALPSIEHEPYARLGGDDQAIVRRLSALLRIADGLDRPHLQSAYELRCEITDRLVQVRIQTRNDPEAHRAGAARKRELFEIEFGVPVEFSLL